MLVLDNFMLNVEKAVLCTFSLILNSDGSPHV